MYIAGAVADHGDDRVVGAGHLHADPGAERPSQGPADGVVVAAGAAGGEGAPDLEPGGDRLLGS